MTVNGFMQMPFLKFICTKLKENYIAMVRFTTRRFQAVNYTTYWICMELYGTYP